MWEEDPNKRYALPVVYTPSEGWINWLKIAKNLGNLKQCVNPLRRLILIASFKITSNFLIFDLAK